MWSRRFRLHARILSCVPFEYCSIELSQEGDEIIRSTLELQHLTKPKKREVD